MFDTLFESKFHAKCKSCIKLTKIRLVTIKKKRNAVEKYLKNDVADILRNGLDYNAYGRAEALLVEQNITSCYNLIEQFCECISNHLSAMDKQSECPEECKEAVASLIYAAARFSDLPELRELRSLFTRKYGGSLEPFINKEFHEKIRARPPTKDMKLRLMKGIALEISLDWDSKALEQKLFCPPPHSDQVKNNHLLEQDGKDARYRLSNPRERYKSERNGNRHSSSEDEVATIFTDSSIDSTDLDGLKSSSSIASLSEDDSETKRPFPYRFISPPYVKQNNGRHNNSNESAVDYRPKPKSVKRRSPSHGNVQNNKSNQAARRISQCTEADTDEDEIMDKLLAYHSNRRSPYVDEEKGDEQIGNTRRHRGTKPEPISRLSRGLSVPPEATNPKMPTGIHSRAASLQPDMLAGHVHPKLPDYDDLAARFAAFRGK